MCNFPGLERKLKLLFQRPRIDYRISEYVYNFINKHILEKYKIMQTGNYHIVFSFGFYDKNVQKYFEDSLYNTETTKHSLHTHRETENGIKYKVIQLFCRSTEITENIKPKEYANIVYDMVGIFLIGQYKKITKEIMDKIKIKMNYTFIEKFKYPAFFVKQKYMLDRDGVTIEYCDIGIVKMKEEYIKYYGK
jgi:hypothetical protein